jgi:hypothetical protein
MGKVISAATKNDQTIPVLSGFEAQFNIGFLFSVDRNESESCFIFPDFQGHLNGDDLGTFCQAHF